MLTVAGLAAHAIRATEPRDAGPLGLASVALAPDGSPFEDDSLDAGFLDELRPREALYRTYDAASDTPVWVFMAYFDRQNPGPWRSGSLHGLVVSNGVEKRLVCYWYQTPRGIVVDALPLKLALLRRAVARASQDVVFANVSTPLTADMESAFARVAPYARNMEDEIARLYRERDERHTHPL